MSSKTWRFNGPAENRIPFSMTHIHNTTTFQCNDNYRKINTRTSNYFDRMEVVLQCTVDNMNANFPSVGCNPCAANFSYGQISTSGKVTCIPGSYHNASTQSQDCNKMAVWENFGECVLCLVPTGRNFYAIDGTGNVSCDIGYTKTRGPLASSNCSIAHLDWQIQDVTCNSNCSITLDQLLVEVPKPRQFVLTCNCFDDLTPPVYTWALNTAFQTPTTVINSTTGNLEINITVLAVGNYTCTAKNNRGQHVLRTVNIQVYAAPKLTFSSHNATNATNATITCTSASNPVAIETYWTFENNTIVGNSSNHFIGRASPPTLNMATGLYEVSVTMTVQMISYADRLRVYQCKARNGVAREQAHDKYNGQSAYEAARSVSFNVQTETAVSVQPISERTYLLHGTIVLRSEATGNPLPLPTWISTDSAFTMQRANVTTTYNTLTHTTITTLVIRNVTTDLSGSYYCQFTNPFSTVNTSHTNVSIKAHPINEFISPKITTNESSTVTLQCTFKANPEPQIAWYTTPSVAVDLDDPRFTASNLTMLMDDGLYYTQLNLSIANVTRNDRYDYLCVATNGIAQTEEEVNNNLRKGIQSSYSSTATVRLNVDFPTTFFQTPLARYNIDIHQNFTITCSANGSPAVNATWMWILANETLENVTITTRVSGTLTTTQLKILDAEYNTHAGNYTCILFNDLGLVNETTIIDVSDIDECASNPCVRGACTSGIGRYTCKCPTNYAGTNCDIPLSDFDECISNPCQNNATCVDGLGLYTCRCAAGFTGRDCQSLIDCQPFHRRAQDGIFCERCDCDSLGTTGCGMENGTCFCKNSIAGERCDECKPNLYQSQGTVAQCVDCPCPANKTVINGSSCDQKTGQCNCQPKYAGHSCEICNGGYYQADGECLECGCNSAGSLNLQCHVGTGQCDCKPGSTGRTCAACDEGFFVPNAMYRFCIPEVTSQVCQACHCSPNGANGTSCTEGFGQCTCLPGYTGLRCDACIDSNEFYSSSLGCQDLNEPLFTPLPSTKITGSLTDIPLTRDFIFGGQYEAYRSVRVSINGYLSFSGFIGDEYHTNNRVTDDIAIVAPFWTTTLGNSSCKGGSVSAYRISSTTDNATFSEILSQISTTEVFEPTEALVVTWREIGENNSHIRTNTFQAVVIGDDCQSFAILNYPNGGIGWFGNPVAVIAARNVQPDSGSPTLLSTFSTRYNNRRRVVNLTPSCSSRLRGALRCKNSVVKAPKHEPVQCPANLQILSVLTLFNPFRSSVGSNCYRTTPVILSPNMQRASVCCYDTVTGELITAGAQQPYETYQRNDNEILRQCTNGASLSTFFGNRNSPLATDTRIPQAQGSSFGDPHIITTTNMTYGFHGIGEFIMAEIVADDFSISVYARMGANPVNQFNFTSINRIAFSLKFGTNQSEVVFEAYSSDSSQLQITGNNYTFTEQDLSKYEGLQLIKNTLRVSIGAVGVIVNVQFHPILSASFQIPDNLERNVSGLLNIQNGMPMLNLSDSKSVYNAAYGHRVTEASSPFTYSDDETFSIINPPPLNSSSIVETYDFNISADTDRICGTDRACVADFIATGNENIATTTVNTEQVLHRSSEIAARRPPLLAVSNSTLMATYQKETTVTFSATASSDLSIASIEVSEMIGFEGDLFTSTFDNMTSVLTIQWTPQSRRNATSNMKLTVQAKDTNNDTSSYTISIVLCSCDKGSCNPIPSISYSSFTLQTCNCSTGYTGVVCTEDEDGCSLQPCHHHRPCIDEKAPATGHSCGACARGYRTGIMAGSCVNNDECEMGTHFCSKNISYCLDTRGSYVCPCATGYSGAGNTTCRDNNECNEGTHGCDDPNAVCTNTIASYTCSCRRGFTGTGITSSGGCQDINQCANNQHDCIPFSVCRDLEDMPGHHTCTCPDGQLQTDDINCDVTPTVAAYNSSIVNVTKTVGEDVAFGCDFTGLIRGGLVWRQPDNSTISRSGNGFTYTSVTRGNTSAFTALTFTVTGNTRQGAYSCIGGNSRGRVSHTFNLLIPRGSSDSKNILIIIIASSASAIVLLLLITLAFRCKGGKNSFNPSGHAESQGGRKTAIDMDTLGGKKGKGQNNKNEQGGMTSNVL